MPVEIMNTYHRPLPGELEEALKSYAYYHPLQAKANRVIVTTETWTYDVRCAIIELDKQHYAIWIVDWHEQ